MDIGMTERFRLAAERLAIDPGDVRCRLKKAYVNILVFNDDELPEDLREDFIWIKAQMQANPTLFRMHSKTASKIAKRIFDISIKLSRRDERSLSR